MNLKLLQPIIHEQPPFQIADCIIHCS